MIRDTYMHGGGAARGAKNLVRCQQLVLRMWRGVP